MRVSGAERTLAIIKPDAVSKKAIGRIIQKIEDGNFAIAGLKMMRLSGEDASRFYSVHRGKEFFDPLVAFMSSGPIVMLVLEGVDVVARWRRIMGPTDPAAAGPETVRRAFGTDVRHNACHGSDSAATAEQEIGFFFTQNELMPGQ